MIYCTACVNETADAGLVSGFACTNSLLQLWILFKPNILLEQCDFFFQSGETQHSKALSLQAILRAFQSDSDFNFKIIWAGVQKKEILILQMEL